MKTRKLLELANRNSERLVLLISDILDMERIETGNLECHFKAIDLLALAQISLDVNRCYASEHNVQLQFIDGDAGPLNIQGDEHRLMQVFERFSQADSSDSRDKGGTGLGLAITKKIIDRHDGYIDYVSDPGKGTEIYFDIPEWNNIPEDSAEQKSENDLPFVYSGSTPRVLICEDDADLAHVISCILEEQGLNAEIAKSGMSTKILLKEGNFDLLLADLNLPDMDGLQLLVELRKDDKTRQLPVIVISVRVNETRDSIDANALEVVDWLQKPIDNTRLSAALKLA